LESTITNGEHGYRSGHKEIRRERLELERVQKKLK